MPKKADRNGKQPDPDKGNEKPFVNAARVRESRVSRIISSVELFVRLKGRGRDWDAEMEKLLAPPPNLYENSGGSSQYFSKDRTFGISEVVLNLRHGAHINPKETEYGIALYETPNIVYFVLVDMSRRIVVKERIQSLQSDPPELSWTAVKAAIKYAASVAERTDRKSFVLYDGIPRVLEHSADSSDDAGMPPPVFVPKAK
ncbi:MAG: hypothetical protein MN733_24320 [Nitrososphaera sp.]|nr:hypothetical protein [Nitrososphaera sp.]